LVALLIRRCLPVRQTAKHGLARAAAIEAGFCAL
jgi:hypothetical protein